MIGRLIRFVTARLFPAPQKAAAPSSGIAPAEPRVAIPAAEPPLSRRGRPMSATLVRTLEMLAANPAVTPAEVSSELGVAASYARTLLRRARERSNEPAPVAARPRVQAVPAAVAPAPAPVEVLLGRLEAMESEMRELRSSGPPQPRRERWDLSRRAEVIRRGLAGEDPAQIAACLRVPRGEVRFILKVQRLLMNAG
jgi:hypothetical protein